VDFTVLPAVNAGLNAAAAVLIVAGYALIRRGRRVAHQRVMTAAVCVSAVFLATYVTHKVLVGPRSFGHEGEAVRTVYLAILLSHTVLAAAIVPLVIVTVVLGFRSRFESHKKIARWTLPVWLYVSVTGVLVYLMLYHWYA
jgi:uncharacterized membrane protein YozB (DUF420 family)